ncbi:MAG: hypothetical protein ACE5NP_02310 [Anaerolineae bacterium]
MDWVVAVSIVAALIVAGSQYFLVFGDAPRPLRLMAASTAGVIVFLVAMRAGRG